MPKPTTQAQPRAVPQAATAPASPPGRVRKPSKKIIEASAPDLPAASRTAGRRKVAKAAADKPAVAKPAKPAVKARAKPKASASGSKPAKQPAAQASKAPAKAASAASRSARVREASDPEEQFEEPMAPDGERTGGDGDKEDNSEWFGVVGEHWCTHDRFMHPIHDDPVNQDWWAGSLRSAIQDPECSAAHLYPSLVNPLGYTDYHPSNPCSADCTEDACTAYLAPAWREPVCYDGESDNMGGHCGIAHGAFGYRLPGIHCQRAIEARQPTVFFDINPSNGLPRGCDHCSAMDEGCPAMALTRGINFPPDALAAFVAHQPLLSQPHHAPPLRAQPAVDAGPASSFRTKHDSSSYQPGPHPNLQRSRSAASSSAPRRADHSYPSDPPRSHFQSSLPNDFRPPSPYSPQQYPTYHSSQRSAQPARSDVGHTPMPDLSLSPEGRSGGHTPRSSRSCSPPRGSKRGRAVYGADDRDDTGKRSRGAEQAEASAPSSAPWHAHEAPQHPHRNPPAASETGRERSRPPSGGYSNDHRSRRALLSPISEQPAHRTSYSATSTLARSSGIDLSDHLPARIHPTSASNAISGMETFTRSTSAPHPHPRSARNHSSQPRVDSANSYLPRAGDSGGSSARSRQGRSTPSTLDVPLFPQQDATSSPSGTSRPGAHLAAPPASYNPIRAALNELRPLDSAFLFPTPGFNRPLSAEEAIDVHGKPKWHLELYQLAAELFDAHQTHSGRLTSFAKTLGDTLVDNAARWEEVARERDWHTTELARVSDLKEAAEKREAGLSEQLAQSATTTNQLSDRLRGMQGYDSSKIEAMEMELSGFRRAATEHEEKLVAARQLRDDYAGGVVKARGMIAKLQEELDVARRQAARRTTQRVNADLACHESNKKLQKALAENTEHLDTIRSLQQALASATASRVG